MDAGSQTIAVIGGTGAEGRGIALRLANAGYRVIIGTRDPSKAGELVSSLNHMVQRNTIECRSNIEAADASEIVILTVPYSAQETTVRAISESLRGKILIDATAPLVPPKVGQVQLPAGGSAVAKMQALLGDSVRVVSAFQNISAQKLQKLKENVDCDVLVCADDVDARRTVIELLAKMGLRGIDAGPICNSAATEALTSILISINRKYKLPSSGIRITGIGDGNLEIKMER